MYPLAATIMSEYSSRHTRGAYVSLVFAMQGTDTPLHFNVLYSTTMHSNVRSLSLFPSLCPSQSHSPPLSLSHYLSLPPSLSPSLSLSSALGLLLACGVCAIASLGVSYNFPSYDFPVTVSGQHVTPYYATLQHTQQSRVEYRTA
jgi:hypothetical protein